jgi:hypothetical protein
MPDREADLQCRTDDRFCTCCVIRPSSRSSLLSPPPTTFGVNGVQYVAIMTHPVGDAFTTR